MEALTRAAVVSLTLFEELRTRDTVAVETPAWRATVRISIEYESVYPKQSHPGSE
jgi:hypothetical protein